LSPVIDLNPSADVLQEYRRQHLMDRYGEDHEGLAGSETSSMHGSYLNGSREALYLSLVDCIKDRMENPKGVTP